MSAPAVFRPSDLQYPRRIVVDDTDPRVIYDSGTWDFDVSTFNSDFGFGIYGQPYNQTMRGTNSREASFTFHFEANPVLWSLIQILKGDFVQVKGAKDVREGSRPVNNTNTLPKYTCEVDGSNVQNVSYFPSLYAITNNVLCEGTRLSPGQHTLTMNITLTDVDAQTFWLDSIEYAYPEGTDVSREVVKVDASDPSCVYHNETRAWIGNSGLSNGTGTVGASMTFRFNGSSVSLYSWNAGMDTTWDPSFGNYYIDDSGSTEFDIPRSKPLPYTRQNSSDWFNQRLFTSKDSKVNGEKEHAMVITYTGTKTRANSPQWLLVDYFYVTGAAANGSPQGSNAGETDDGEGGRGTQRKKPVTAIAGGVIGGVVGLLAIAGIVWFFLRRRRRRKGPRELYPKEELDPTPLIAESGEPFHRSTSPAPSIVHHPTRSIYSGDGTTTLSYHPATTASLYSISSADEGATSGDGNTSSYHNQNQVQNFSDMKSAQREVVSVQTRQHQDSGIRYSQNKRGQSQFVDVPPTYTAN
ncbi:hypothetical protein AAF712_009935 [Marasmius tenuissimus]|uniref:Uncharacterized protein n=1 Tax=Marasmius tenuissimus TaxID=585030 RepID=A0ABR2ZPB7_9AGAR